MPSPPQFCASRWPGDPRRIGCAVSSPPPSWGAPTRLCLAPDPSKAAPPLAWLGIPRAGAGKAQPGWESGPRRKLWPGLQRRQQQCLPTLRLAAGEQEPDADTSRARWPGAPLDSLCPVRGMRGCCWCCAAAAAFPPPPRAANQSCFSLSSCASAVAPRGGAASRSLRGGGAHGDNGPAPDRGGGGAASAPQ